MNVDETLLRPALQISESVRNVHTVYENKVLSVKKCQRQFTQFQLENLILKVFLHSG